MTSSEPPIQQIPIEVQSVVKNVFERFKDIKQTNIRTLIEDIITFLSIIGAYYCVSVSLEKEKEIEKWTGIKLGTVDAEAGLLLVFALYLLGLKGLYFIAYKYDTAPPKKVLPPNWEDMEESQIPSKPTSQTTEPPALSSEAYSILIQELLNYSIYGLVFMFCTTAYTFHINYMVLWFVAACIFYSLGKIIGKITQIKTFHHFGLTIGIMLIIIQIGLSHGFNMFLFI